MSYLRSLPALILCTGLGLPNAYQLPVDWQNRYDRFAEMVRRHNLSGLQAFMSDQYVCVLPEGRQLARAQVIKKYAYVMNSREVTGSVAVKQATKGRDTIEINFDSSWTAVGADGKVTMHEVGVDTWRRFGIKWQIVRTDVQSERFYGPPESIAGQ